MGGKLACHKADIWRDTGVTAGDELSELEKQGAKEGEGKEQHSPEEHEQAHWKGVRQIGETEDHAERERGVASGCPESEEEEREGEQVGGELGSHEEAVARVEGGGAAEELHCEGGGAAGSETRVVAHKSDDQDGGEDGGEQEAEPREKELGLRSATAEEEVGLAHGGEESQVEGGGEGALVLCEDEEGVCEEEERQGEIQEPRAEQTGARLEKVEEDAHRPSASEGEQQPHLKQNAEQRETTGVHEGGAFQVGYEGGGSRGRSKRGRAL